jgi:hypothetical protein
VSAKASSSLRVCPRASRWDSKISTAVHRSSDWLTPERVPNPAHAGDPARGGGGAASRGHKVHYREPLVDCAGCGWKLNSRAISPRYRARGRCSLA